MSVYMKKKTHIENNLNFQWECLLTATLVGGENINEMNVYMKKETHIEKNWIFNKEGR